MDAVAHLLAFCQLQPCWSEMRSAATRELHEFLYVITHRHNHYIRHHFTKILKHERPQ